MTKKEYFKEAIKKEELIITRINFNKMYFKLGDFRYLILEGIDDDYESYTCLYQVEQKRRKVVETLGFCYGHINPISLIEIKGDKRFGRGVAYSHIVNTDKLKARLLNLIN